MVSIPIGVVILLALKSYLLLCFAGATLLTIFVSANFVISNRKKRLPINIITIIGLLLGFIYLSIYPDTFSDFYVATFKKQTDAIQDVAIQATIQSDGSGYILPGVDDLSLPGIINSLLQSTNVALFRPYFWESHNIMTLLNALESFIVMLFFIWILIKAKFYLFFSVLAKKPILQFAFFFTLILAPMVGFISLNFGTLVRYKVPFVPFFYTLLLLSNKLINKKNKIILKINGGSI
ncbi:MAG: hypothetical protein IPP48_05635 [Chitinophagaceae bacterium]|nr:hypothetical protein [Chitinophagaceae bacterium]